MGDAQRIEIVAARYGPDPFALLQFGAIFLGCSPVGGIAFWMTERVSVASVAWAVAFVFVAISLSFTQAQYFGVAALAEIAGTASPAISPQRSCWGRASFSSPAGRPPDSEKA